MTKWLLIIPIAVAAIIVSISFYLQPNDFIGCKEQPTAKVGQCAPADAIVVVSGGDTNARTDQGIRLFNNGWADTIIFSGAAQDKSGPSNAASMKARAIEFGIPEEAILIDESSETTEQNAQNSQSIFEKNGYKNIILVTSGYHQRRASMEFQRHSDSVKILDHPLIADQDWSIWWWLTTRGWWLAGSEVGKVVILHFQGENS